MRVIVGLGHPAHYHLFKHFIEHCKINGIVHKVVILNKDVLEDLLIRDNIPFTKLIDKKPTKSLFEKLKELKRANKEFKIVVKEFKPSIMIGCINQIAYAGWGKRIPSIFFAEDDFKATFLQGLLVYPFIDKVLTPVSTSVGPFKYKQIKYNSFHELAYLHPNHFKPEINKVKGLVEEGKPYVILRFSDLKAYHDLNKGGISTALAFKIIRILSPKVNIYITSERPLVDELEPYRINIPSTSMHHALYYADLFIGDSQTMAAEAAILGTPAIRYNNFIGKLGYLDEIELTFSLGFGISVGHEDILLDKIEELVSVENLNDEWQIKKNRFLAQKIDYSKFMIWFVSNYPKSLRILKKNPRVQDKFK